MNRRRWIAGAVAVACAGGGVGIGFATGLAVGSLRAREVTTSRLAPDETLRAWLVEWGWMPRARRRFSVGIDDVATGRVRTVLLASREDEGGPPGTERFVWSRDGTKLLLVGRHFFVSDDLMLANGDQAYLLHDRTSGRSWLNSAGDQDLPRLTADLLAGVDFTEPVVLKPRARVDPDSPGKPE